MKKKKGKENEKYRMHKIIAGPANFRLRFVRS